MTLCDRVRAGDQQAIEELYRLVRGRVAGSARNCYRDHWEDRIHDTFLALLEAIRNRSLRYECEPVLITWAQTVVRQANGDGLLRWKKHNRQLDHLPHVQRSAKSETEPPDEWLEREEILAMLNHALPQVLASQRAVLQALYVDGLSREETIARLNLNDTSYRLLKWRGLQALRNATGIGHARRIEPITEAQREQIIEMRLAGATEKTIMRKTHLPGNAIKYAIDRAREDGRVPTLAPKSKAAAA